MNLFHFQISFSTHQCHHSLDPDMDEEGNEEAGWQLARRGIHRALNNEVEEAQDLLKAEVDSSGCPQAQAGFCFIAFMVSTRNTGAAVRAARTWIWPIYLSTAAPVTFANSKPGTNSIAFDLHFDPQQSYARLGGEAVSLAVSCSDDRGRKWASSSGGGGAVMPSLSRVTLSSRAVQCLRRQ